MRANKNHALLALLTGVVSRAAADNPALPQWMPPAPTRGLDPLDRVHLQVSPRPTRSPQVDRNELLRRADSSIGSNTCGFLTGDRKFDDDAGPVLGQFPRRWRSVSPMLTGMQTALSRARKDRHAPTLGATVAAAEAATARPHPFRRYV